AYEFMVQTLRRGFPSVAAAVADLFQMHPAQTIFTMTAVLLFLCLLIVVRLSRLILADRNPLFAWLIAAAVGFNCNLLFILYEGGYQQIASLPLIVGVIWCQYGGVPLGG